MFLPLINNILHVPRAKVSNATLLIFPLHSSFFYFFFFLDFLPTLILIELIIFDGFDNQHIYILLETILFESELLVYHLKSLFIYENLNSIFYLREINIFISDIFRFFSHHYNIPKLLFF